MEEQATTNSSGGASMDAYSFGTLWQEITRAVGYMMTGITDVFGNRDAARTNETKIREYYFSERNKQLLNTSDGTYLTTIIVLFAGVGFIIWLLNKNKKK